MHVGFPFLCIQVSPCTNPMLPGLGHYNFQLQTFKAPK